MSGTTTWRRLVAGAIALAGTVALTGCGADFSDLPLPGKGVSGDTMEISATFDEALNLADGATVKVNGISVGKVQSVETEDFKAEVELLIQKEAKLRKGATARLRYTTPLGELFVDVVNPARGELMRDGDHMGTDVTDTAPTVEDALASASLLINGGGLAQLGIVTDELNTTLGGRETTLRNTFRQVNTFLRQANASTAQIDRALRELGAVSELLGNREETINRAVSDFRPAIKVLRENREALTALIEAINDVTATANEISRKSADDLLTIIREVEPILAQLDALKPRFASGLRAIVALGKAIDEDIPGDYLNLHILLHTKEIRVGGEGSGNPPITLPIPDLPLPDLPLPNLPLPNLPLPLPDLDLPLLGRTADRDGDGSRTDEREPTLSQLLGGAR
jgi:phospholipid/cholesterol/gamma-HCH transport system substrate-binding protein